MKTVARRRALERRLRGAESDAVACAANQGHFEFSPEHACRRCQELFRAARKALQDFDANTGD